jgi:predicted nucleic acid-binding protein
VIVVSNASPIINLAAIGQLDLLYSLYGQIFIPDAVHAEIVIRGSGLPGAHEVATATWIEARSITNNAALRSLTLLLDPGEAEVILLALEMQADLALLDEKLGRRVAKRLGLDVVGLLGILLEAKHKNYVPRIRPLVDELVTTARFRISRALYEDVLRAAGER